MQPSGGMRTLILLAALTCSACGIITGSGHAVNEARTVPAFSRVSLASGFTGTVDPGMRRVELTADDNLLPWLETVVENGTLYVRVQPGAAIHPLTNLRVAITNDVLEGISLSGGSTFVGAATPIDTFHVTASGGSRAHVTGLMSQELVLDASGASSITVEGSASSVRAVASGGSTVLTRDTSATTASIDGSGASSLTVRATGAVSGQLSGASHLVVFGNGAITVSTSGGSTISRGDQ